LAYKQKDKTAACDIQRRPRNCINNKAEAKTVDMFLFLVLTNGNVENLQALEEGEGKQKCYVLCEFL
jgi:hypothetical protein